MENKNKRKLSPLIIGSIAEVWLCIYAVFRVWTVWYSFQVEASMTDRMAIVVFMCAELFILMQGVGYVSNSLRAMRKYSRKIVSYRLSAESPYVEVLIPSFQEPPEVLRKTIIAAKCLDYPNYSIKILDDSADEKFIVSTKQVAEELEVDYVQQPYPRHGAKAGNLNEFLKISKAKYWAIFDADYRPTRDFLKLVVPQLEEDKRVAYVQTPQFYSNIKTSVVSMAAQTVQSIFFEYISEGKSMKNAIFLCGTNFVISTEALRSVNGFSEESVTEDFATSLKLYQKGYKASYYNFVVAFGEGPASFEEYFKQQHRWAKGTIEVFLKNFKTLLGFGTKMTFSQRVEFFLSGNYYFIGLAWLIMIVIPPLYILFNVPVYLANPLFYVGAYSPYFIFTMMFYFQTLTSRHYPPKNMLMSQSLTILTLPIFIQAAFEAIFRRKTKFVVTSKNVDVLRTKVIPWKYMKAQLFIIYVNVFAIWVGVLKLGVSQEKTAIIINIVWAVFHIMIMTYLPLLVFLERRKWITKTVSNS